MKKEGTLPATRMVIDYTKKFSNPLFVAQNLYEATCIYFTLLFCSYAYAPSTKRYKKTTALFSPLISFGSLLKIEILFFSCGSTSAFFFV